MKKLGERMVYRDFVLSQLLAGETSLLGHLQKTGKRQLSNGVVLEARPKGTGKKIFNYFLVAPTQDAAGEALIEAIITGKPLGV